MDGGLQLFLFGAFRAEQDGQLLTAFESDKARLLLAYLALQPGRPERRETLCSLLWPALADAEARHNLSQTLYSLRELLGDRRAETPLLLADRHTVQVSPVAPLYVDALHFDELLARYHQEDAPPGQRARWRQEVVTIYRGEFLQGLSAKGAAAIDDWSSLQRERRHQQMLEALQWLADYHEARGELADGERYARQQVRMEPWREEAHRQLMRLLAHQGRRSAALAQYERCRQALAESFDVAPAPTTVALYRHIRQAERARFVKLPGENTPFVGRRQELAELAAALARPEQRLITILGSGGSGKTRLALALAGRVQERFLDGVVAVFLTDITGEDEMLSALVGTLELPFGQGNLLARLQDYLQNKEMLLVLDNCEQLPAAGPVARRLLDAAPGLKIVATSRHPLRQSGEWRFPLGGLALTPPQRAGTDPAGAGSPQLEADASRPEADPLLPEAGALFLQAARRLQPSFTPDEATAAAIVDVCALVDGLPLAVEMAASWVPAAPVKVIAAEIRRTLDFLVANAEDASARHRSLRAVWNYSWALLSPPEQRALVRLTVFEGTFGHEAMREIAGVSLPTAAALVDKSLLQQAGDGRYRLHALVREYAAEARDGAEAATLADAHSAYYLALLAGHEESLLGPGAAEARAALRPEMENVRAAWKRALARSRPQALAPALDPLAHFYRLEGLPGEAEEVFGQAALALAEMERAEPLRARLLAHRARFLVKLGKTEQATATARQAIGLAPDASGKAAAQVALGRALELRGEHEEAGDAFGRALALYRRLDDGRGTAEALNGRGNIFWRQADYGAALDDFRKALELDRAVGNRPGMSRHLSNIGIVHRELGQFKEALAALEEARALAEALAHREHIARAENNVGLVYWQMGRRREALNAFRQAAAIAEELGLGRGLVVTTSNIGIIERERGRYDEAMAHYRRAIFVAREIGFDNAVAVSTGNMANLLRDMGRYEEALRYYEEALALDDELGNREGVGRHWGEMGRYFALQGEDERALAYLKKAVRRLRDVGARYYLASVLPALADVCLRLGKVEAASAFNAEGEALAEELDRADARAEAAVVAARLAAADGNATAVRARLEPLAENSGEPADRAAIYYVLWELTGDVAHGEQALAAYRSLAAATPNATYHGRYKALERALGPTGKSSPR